MIHVVTATLRMAWLDSGLHHSQGPRWRPSTHVSMGHCEYFRIILLLLIVVVMLFYSIVMGGPYCGLVLLSVPFVKSTILEHQHPIA